MIIVCKGKKKKMWLKVMETVQRLWEGTRKKLLDHLFHSFKIIKYLVIGEPIEFSTAKLGCLEKLHDGQTNEGALCSWDSTK